MAGVTYRLKNGQTLQATSYSIDATPAAEPDPAWAFTDKKGHVHTWVSGTWENYRPPEDVDDWIPYSYCKLCSEHVRPGMRPGRRQVIAGPVEYYLDDDPITKEQAEALLA